jgi:hypothetical protein
LTANAVLNIADCKIKNIKSLLNQFNLNLELITSNSTSIPGSYWGDSEAGLISNTVYVRPDTPIHSLLHETCHYICMDDIRRQVIDTNAEGDYDEENGVCYLQILLADDIPEMGRSRMLQDMDSWGYTFRLGSAKAWFEGDAEGALQWLKTHHIVDGFEEVSYELRSNKTTA